MACGACAGRELFVQEAWAAPHPRVPPAPRSLPRRMFFQGPAEQMAFGLWPGSLMGTDPTSHPRLAAACFLRTPQPGQTRLRGFSISLSRGVPGLPASGTVRATSGQGLTLPPTTEWEWVCFYH